MADPQPTSPQSASPRPGAPAPAPSPVAPPTFDILIQQAMAMVEEARPMPLSTASMIQKDEVLAVLKQAMSSLPDELRAARWLLKEREEFLDKVRREGDELLEVARTRAERMVQRTEVVRNAEARARHLLDEAESSARRMQHEADDYCDARLGQFEATLERTLGEVTRGRQRLAATAMPVDVAADPDAEIDLRDRSTQPGAIFDQDLQ